MNSNNQTPNRHPLPKKPEDSRTRMGSSITAKNTPVRAAKEKTDATRVSSAVTPVKKRTAPPKDAPVRSRVRVRKKEEKKSSEGWKGLRSTAVRALLYIAIVVGVASLLSVFAIRWANDIFALVKEENVATVVIDQDATISEVARVLEQNGVIEYPLIFRMYENFKHRNDDPPLTFRPGTYQLKSSMNYDQIVNTIKYKKTRKIVTLTIPEGYTVNEIIEFFLSEGIGTREGFEDAINHFEYEYKFMNELNSLELSKDRKYRLEGYLFPDTYDFYTDSSEVAIIDKMLQAFESKFESVYYERLKEMGYNLDQVITMASLVQGEGMFPSDFGTIASVFYNRLNNWNPKYLNSDATIQYILNAHKEDLTQEDLNINDPYNTYLYQGLPPGAICNPGWDAIEAALYPEASNYYYFVSDTDGSTLFARNQSEHLDNVAAVQRARENKTHVD